MEKALFKAQNELDAMRSRLEKLADQFLEQQEKVDLKRAGQWVEPDTRPERACMIKPSIARFDDPDRPETLTDTRHVLTDTELDDEYVHTFVHVALLLRDNSRSHEK